jgi:hypothetical protein
MHDDAQKIKDQTNLKRGFFWAVTASLVTRQKPLIAVLSVLLLLYLRIAFCLSCKPIMAASKFLRSS